MLKEKTLNFCPIGFRETVNIGQADYLKQIGGAAGARVVVHPPGTMPHPEEHGVLAEPGKLTSTAMTKVKT